MGNLKVRRPDNPTWRTRHIRKAAALLATLGAVLTLTAFLVVGGTPTTQYPQVGAVLILDALNNFIVQCSGTLIAPNTVLTAAHCLSPKPVKVFFQGSGLYDVADTLSADHQTDQPQNDVGLIFLTAPVKGISPSPIAVGAIPGNGTIVGYGWHRDKSQRLVGPGIKESADVPLDSCAPIYTDTVLLCWMGQTPTPPTAATCSGDSGGPLFVEQGSKEVLAGVHSKDADCRTGSLSVDVKVSAVAAWIAKNMRAGTNAGALVSPPARVPKFTFDCGEDSDHATLQSGICTGFFNLPKSASTLVATINASVATYPLVPLKIGISSPQGASPCPSATNDAVVVCKISSPKVGTWKVTVSGKPGREFQVVVAIM